jgi:hypothetical protein
MKRIIVILFLTALVSSCASVDVAVDYDRKVNFDTYKTYAFFKPGIDQAKISDLDKKRILRAIDNELSAKGMSKSEDPDVLISIMTETKERVNIYQNNFGFAWGWGWGWGGMPGGGVSSSTTVEGTLFVDIIDAKKRELVWQGLGTDALTQRMDKKEEKIKEIVNEILSQYPPTKEDKK